MYYTIECKYLKKPNGILLFLYIIYKCFTDLSYTYLQSVLL